MTPVFHPEAEQEVAAALKVGEERGFGLGRELVQEIRRVSALLCDVPHIGEPLDSRHRSLSVAQVSVWSYLSR